MLSINRIEATVLVYLFDMLYEGKGYIEEFLENFDLNRE